MAQVAKDAGIGRESLYKALALGAKPRFETAMKVAFALGVKFNASLPQLESPKPQGVAMRDQVAELVRQGRKLALTERERLVDELLLSLNETAVVALDGAWEQEIAKRLAEYDRGEVEAIDADIVFAKARRLAGE